jgi:hypothetical protein
MSCVIYGFAVNHVVSYLDHGDYSNLYAEPSYLLWCVDNNPYHSRFGELSYENGNTPFGWKRSKKKKKIESVFVLHEQVFLISYVLYVDL